MKDFQHVKSIEGGIFLGGMEGHAGMSTHSFIDSKAFIWPGKVKEKESYLSSNSFHWSIKLKIDESWETVNFPDQQLQWKTAKAQDIHLVEIYGPGYLPLSLYFSSCAGQPLRLCHQVLLANSFLHSRVEESEFLNFASCSSGYEANSWHVLKHFKKNSEPRKIKYGFSDIYQVWLTLGQLAWRDCVVLGSNSFNLFRGSKQRNPCVYNIYILYY